MTTASESTANTADARGMMPARTGRQSPFDEALASVNILISKQEASSLGIKVKDRIIEFAIPDTWPRLGIPGNDRHTWRAGLIDTAEILKTNGYPADTPFSIVVGGVELDTGNTYRIQGRNTVKGRLQNNAQNDKAYTAEYGNVPGESGIWRTLKFSNYRLTHGFAPSLRKHLSSDSIDSASTDTTADNYRQPHNRSAAESMTRDRTNKGLPGDNTGQAGYDQFLAAVNHSNPDIRAEGLTKLVSHYQKGKRQVAPAIAEGLRDENDYVRETSLGMLETWEGPLPDKALADVALHDESTPLRIHALDLLAYKKGGKAMEILRQARLDPDPMVSQFANQLISELRQANHAANR